MALSVGVFVGKSKNLIPLIAKTAAELKMGPGAENGIDISPVAYSEVF